MKEENCGDLFCHDCRKKITVNDQKIVNGVFLRYKDGLNDYTIVKCDHCYDMKPELANYKKCEVYSRVVGYIRPVEQWNKGKQQEYKERKHYKV